MIVIVEGPDNAGKTTLALKLSKLLKAVYIKNEDLPPKASYSLDDYHFVLMAANRICDWVITDRHLAISNPIYAPILGRICPLNRADIDRVLTPGIRVIYCRPPDEKILESMGDREHMKGVFENAAKIVKAYDTFFRFEPVGGKHLAFPFTEYNFCRDIPEEVADWLRRSLH